MTNSFVHDAVSGPVPVFRRDLHAIKHQGTEWIWPGYLARGHVTLLTSQWKCGKTTLLSVLLHHMNGGGLLADAAIRPGRAVVLSEEPVSMWCERDRKFQFHDDTCWYCRPFRGKPTPQQWLSMLDGILEMHDDYPFDLLVIDPLANFLTGNIENSAAGIVEFLTSLERLTSRQLGVLILHHPRKKEEPDGKASRGSGAMAGFVDVLLELRWFNRPADDDRRRALLAWSRFRETPKHQIIELNAGATDYIRIADDVKPGDDQFLQALHCVFEQAEWKLSRKEILDVWPYQYPIPSRVYLWGLLERRFASGRLRRDGSGVKNAPYRYWSESREKEWRDNLGMQLRLEQDELMEKLRIEHGMF